MSRNCARIAFPQLIAIPWPAGPASVAISVTPGGNNGIWSPLTALYERAEVSRSSRFVGVDECRQAAAVEITFFAPKGKR